MWHSRERLIRPSGWVGQSSRRTRRQAGSRRAKEAAGWALPTILSSASLRQARAAASTYARLRAMGAVISASMPAFAITSRRCVRPQPAKVSARPSSLAVLLPDARDCRWQNNWPVAPRGNCREPAAGFQWGGSQLRAAAGRIDPSAPIPAVRWRCRYYFSAQSRTGSSLKRAKHWARTDWKCFRLASQGPSTSARACALAQSRAPKRDAASVR